MIENFKNKLWNMLKGKEISLAMILDKSGKILWNKGRDIEGKNIFDGRGFSKSYILEILNDNKNFVDIENVFISKDSGLPDSAINLNLKSLMIFPISNNFLLYVDSGTKSAFNDLDKCFIKTIGTLLGDIIDHIRNNSIDFGLSGTSKEIEDLREKILHFSIEDETILLIGETGVGKNHVAELIHQYSGKKGKFVTVNTPSIPENLFESELFGHKKGAFTDAKFDKRGLVDFAQGGTLFFDEISEVPLSFQAKLLRFIDSKNYRILGDSKELQADVRIIAATNKNLNSLIETKKFREDLYFRLQVFEIEIPPIRKRKIDIHSLVNDLNKYLKDKKIGEGFWEVMCAYDWPGNVRELKNILIRAGVYFEEPITGEKIKKLIKKKSINGFTKTDFIWNELMDGESFWDVVKKPYFNRDLNREEVKEIIKRGLAITNGIYIKLLDIFNIKKDKYYSFMDFLNKHKLK